jgi:hypothetical protein
MGATQTSVPPGEDHYASEASKVHRRSPALHPRRAGRGAYFLRPDIDAIRERITELTERRHS